MLRGGGGGEMVIRDSLKGRWASGPFFIGVFPLYYYLKRDGKKKKIVYFLFFGEGGGGRAAKMELSRKSRK